MLKSNRRRFIKNGIIFGLVGGYTQEKLTASDSSNPPVQVTPSEVIPKIHPTPSEILGPFHPITPQKDKDFDLTRIDGNTGTAIGPAITVEGRIVDIHGQPLEDASVEIWQANAAGRYAHPHDPNPAPLDPNFQGWAIVLSGKDGSFHFKTVLPGSYPAGENWIRPPHIHYKVSKLGYDELITQMYFPGQLLNNNDLLLQRKKPEEREFMIAQKVNVSEELFRFQIVLENLHDNSPKDKDPNEG